MQLARGHTIQWCDCCKLQLNAPNTVANAMPSGTMCKSTSGQYISHLALRGFNLIKLHITNQNSAHTLVSHHRHSCSSPPAVTHNVTLWLLGWKGIVNKEKYCCVPLSFSHTLLSPIFKMYFSIFTSWSGNNISFSDNHTGRNVQI